MIGRLVERGALTAGQERELRGLLAQSFDGVTAEGFCADLADNEIVINQWLADDLHAAVGDEITLRYFVLEGNELAEAERARLTAEARTTVESDAVYDRHLDPHRRLPWVLLRAAFTRTVVNALHE